MNKTIERVGGSAASADTAPLVSVVIPAFNAQAHLEECLTSVRAQASEVDLEIIVVDDGSIDCTPAIARQHPDVRYLRQANRGPSAARNVGIAAARGEFVAFLDADDLWPSGKLAGQIRILQQHPELALVFGDSRQFDAHAPFARTEFEANHLGAAAWGPGPAVPDAYSRLLDVNFITTGSVVVRRATLDEVGGFAEDLRLVEDLDLWLRIARRRAIAWCDHECLLRRRHTTNISGDAEAMGLAYLEVLRRHRITWLAVEIASMRLDSAPLVSKSYLYLAELAIAQGQPKRALRYAWRSLSSWPRPQTLWRMTKSTIKLMVRRHA